MFQKVCAGLAVGAMLALALTACTAKPQRRPQAPPNHAGVSDIAGQVNGAGKVAAIVLGNTALLALGTDSDRRGGDKVGPTTWQPGGSPAMPGGTINPGGATPHGSPVYDQAAPNGQGGLASSGGSSNMPMAEPSSIGERPMDIANRVADRVRAEFPAITQVKVAINAQDGDRVKSIADLVRSGSGLDQFRSELEQIAQRAMPAGTTTFPNQHPAQGSG